jgi:hypothetical protein
MVEMGPVAITHTKFQKNWFRYSELIGGGYTGRMESHKPTLGKQVKKKLYTAFPLYVGNVTLKQCVFHGWHLSYVCPTSQCEHAIEFKRKLDQMLISLIICEVSLRASTSLITNPNPVYSQK